MYRKYNQICIFLCLDVVFILVVALKYGVDPEANYLFVE